MRNIIFSLSLFSAASFAGTLVSGGGHTIVCRDPQGRSVASNELLDLFEARVIGPAAVDLPADGAFTDANARTVEIAQLMIDRLKKVSPLRAAGYERILSLFFSPYSTAFADNELSFVDDDDSEIVGSHCELKQLAVQRDRTWADDPIFLIDRKLWEGLAPLNQRSSLILHEIIYREFRSYGHLTSSAARRLVRALATDELALDKLGHMRAFLENLYSSNVRETDLGGLWFRLWEAGETDPFRNIKFYPGHLGKVSHLTAKIVANMPLDRDESPSLEITPHIYEVHGALIQLETARINDASRGTLNVDADFNPDGEITQLTVKDDPARGHLLLRSSGKWIPVSRLEWDGQGRLKPIF